MGRQRSATGRLFKLRLKRSAAARRAAQASVTEVFAGCWQARIGGDKRGRVVTFPSEKAARSAVDGHYDRRMREFVMSRQEKPCP